VRWRRKAAEQGEAEALKALKKINTPFAHYTVALLEKDHAKAFSLALTHDELHYEFFHQEIITVVNALQDITSLDTFLTTLQETARKLNKNINASLISALLSIDLATETNDIERNEVTVHLVTELLGLIHLADAEPQQIQLLMHFMCNRFYEVDSPQDLIKPLIILWHRARALEVPMDDSGLNRLIAARIVNHLFKNTHCLKLTLGFQEDDLATLVTAYERKSPLTMEQINTGLSEPLLIDSKHNPKQVLPKLKTCILNPDTWGGEIPPSMQEIIQHLNVQTKDHPLSDKNAEELLLHLQKVAAHLISASNLLSVFKIELKPKEIELLQRIGSVNTSGILEWIETQEALLEQEENTVSL